MGVVGPAVDRYLDALTRGVVEVFADRVVGVWLVGSAAYGGFGTTSDLDVQAAVSGSPSTAEIDQLVELIRHPNLPCPAAGLEFVLYDEEVLRNPTPPLQWALNLNGGPSRPVGASTDPTREPWHWFVLDLGIGREFAVTLLGSPMRDVVGPLDRDVQIAAIAESLRWHQEHEANSVNAAANAARGLLFIETGRWGSKPDGLAWLEATGRPAAAAIDDLQELLRRHERPTGKPGQPNSA